MYSIKGRKKVGRELKAKWTHQKVLKLPQLAKIDESRVEILAVEY